MVGQPPSNNVENLQLLQEVMACKIPWEVLEMNDPVNSKVSNADIKRAYRKMAKCTHPDRFIARGEDNLKELATQAFRRVHVSYETALRWVEDDTIPSPTSSSSSSSSNSNQGDEGDSNEPPSTSSSGTEEAEDVSFSHLQYTYESVCKDIDEERDRRHRHGIEQDVSCCLSFWPAAPDHSWDVIAKSFCKREIIAKIKLTEPKLAEYLERRYNQKMEKMSENTTQKIASAVRETSSSWSNYTAAGHVKRLKANGLWASDIRKVAGQLESIEMKKALLQVLDDERSRNGKRWAIEWQQIADRIGKAYPNRPAMKSILKEVSSWDRKNVLKLLPNQVKACLEEEKHDNGARQPFSVTRTQQDGCTIQ